MITLIACTDLNAALGNEGKLLAHLPNDLAHFKKHTIGKLCVQGRKTYESIIEQIGHDLPERKNIVLTKNKKYKPEEGAFVYHSAKEVIDKYRNQGGDEELMVIGGESIYEQFLSHADKIILTVIHHEFKSADCYFPKIGLKDWEVTSYRLNKADEKHEYNYSFFTLVKKKK